MRKVATLTIFILVVMSTYAHANLIAYSDFSGATLSTTALDPANANSLGKWLGVGNAASSGWSIVLDDTDSYARNWGDGNYVLMQGIAGPFASGNQFSFSMAYAYTEGTLSPPIGVVSILGGNSGDTPIAVYASGSANWEFATWDVLFSHNLDYTGTPDWSSISGNFNLGSSYDTIAIVVRAGLYPGTTGLRAVDDVVIDKVPEASAMFLLGSGLVGLVGYRRMKRML